MSWSSTLKDFWNVVRREMRIILQRPIFFLASFVVLGFNACFYVTFTEQGIPHELPIAVVDMDNSSTSRLFRQNLDATPLGSVIEYPTFTDAREDMQKGRITSVVVLPDGFNNDIQANRRPTIEFYVNNLYFVGGAMAYKDILEMVNLTGGAVQREFLRARGVNDREIMGRIQPIVLDQHMIGNPTTNYGIYLNNILLPGILELIIILVTIYALGQELKYGTSKHLLKVAGDNPWNAIIGKLVPYTIIYTVMGILTILFLYHWLDYPIAGSVWNMFWAMLLLTMASECVGVFIIEMIPTLRLAISVGAIISVLAFSLAGFTLPIDGMPDWVAPVSAIFPLRHYYMLFIQEVIYGSGFAGWWQEAVHLLVYLFLPVLGFNRLYKAYKYQNYPRN